MLEHADRGDLVELAVEPRIVLEFDGHPVLQAEPRDLLLGIGELLLGERDAVGANAVVLRGVNERAPAAADVEKALVRLEPQLAADHVELVALRLREVVVRLGEIGAAVDHLGIEKERVELVGQIVVVLDVLLDWSCSLPSLLRYVAAHLLRAATVRRAARTGNAPRS